MRKTIIFILTLMLMMVSVLSAKSAALPTSMIPDNARWVLHLDMQQFNQTQFSSMLEENYGNKFKAFTQKLADEYKFDMMKDTTSITVFGTDEDKRNFVVCWSGNFDKPHLLSLLAKAPTYEKLDYGKFTIHKWRHSQFGVFVSDRMLMWSMNEYAIKYVLDVVSGMKKSIAGSSMMNYLDNTPGDAFLRAAANNIASLARDREASMILKNTGMALFLAMEKNGNLKLNLTLTTDTPETAKNIEQIVNGFIALARMKQEDKDPRWALLDNLHTNLRGNVLQFELIYPSKDLIAMLNHKRHRHVR